MLLRKWLSEKHQNKWQCRTEATQAFNVILGIQHSFLSYYNFDPSFVACFHSKILGLNIERCGGTNVASILLTRKNFWQRLETLAFKWKQKSTAHFNFAFVGTFASFLFRCDGARRGCIYVKRVFWRVVDTYHLRYSVNHMRQTCDDSFAFCVVKSVWRQLPCDRTMDSIVLWVPAKCRCNSIVGHWHYSQALNVIGPRITGCGYNLR